jgi:Protein of unknown function (DUF3375)
MQQKLLTQIATALESRSEISLLELIEIYPIDCGMEEVVEYLEIAHQPPHTIDDEVKESILVSRGFANEVSNVLQGSQMKTTMPRIIFRRQA